MDTTPTRSIKYKRRGLSLLSVLGGLLLLLPLLVPPVAFASSTNTTQSLAGLSPTGVRDLAGVSVVRLEMFYVRLQTHTAIQCTALGTLVASWHASSTTDQNNWVLTDGSMLAMDGGSCAPQSKLAMIDIFVSDEFTNHSPTMALQDVLNCQSGSCFDQLNGNNGPTEMITKTVGGGVLVSFHSDASQTLPYRSVAQTSTLASPTGIELANAAGAWPPAPQVSAATFLQEFLGPIVNTQTPGNSSGGTSPLTNEPGMPFVDSNGQVTNMQLSGTTTLLRLTDIQSLLSTPLIPAARLANNILSAKWEMGIRQYEQGDYPHAVQTLTSIESDNLSFQAPKVFAQSAMAKIPNGTNGTPTPPQGNAQGSSFLGIPMWWVLIVGLIATVMVLILLFVLVSLTFGRRRALHLRTEVQVNTRMGKISIASLLAASHAQLGRINELLNRRKQPPVVKQQTSLEKEKLPSMSPQPVPIAPNIACPNCGQPVRAGATFCPNCRYVLSPGGQDARPKGQMLQVSEPPAPVKIQTPPNRNEPQQVQVKQDDQAIKATLQRLWDQAEN